MEKRALGKGLSALIPTRIDQEHTEQGERIVYLDPRQIKLNPLQPREYFDETGMQELVQSVKEKGLIQPVLVRRRGDNYELIAGERRFRAACALQLRQIPAIVRQASDRDSLEISLIENIQRQDLNPIEEARAYKYLLEKFQVTQEKIADTLGKSRASVANMLRILNLPQEIQAEIKNGRISFAHGRALLEIADLNLQRRFAQEAIARSLSVRELETLIKMRRPRLGKRKIDQGSREPFVAVLEEELQHLLATKVRISKRKKRGHILIEFYSQEDLQRIIELFRGRVKA